EQLLLLARLDENEFLIKRLPVSLEQLIPSLVEKVRPVIEAEGLTLTVMGDAVTIEGDDVRLGQVVLNLLDNARKYTETGSIEINYGRNSGGPFFTVRDTGIGIAEEDIKRVQERLYRSEPSRSRHYGGAGIGLAIASAIVKAHGASLEIKSQKNQGTTVTVQWEV
ncbi:MAG: HAMP domain-containing sensor histidine kinase, partial [Exiguobacterium oxidotolerans]